MAEILIRGVNEAYGWLGNMSPHPVRCEGRLFKTSEHLFQWKRYDGYPEIQKELLAQQSPMGLKMKAKKHRKILVDEGRWVHTEESDILLMKDVLETKISQHRDLARKLRLSHPHVIIEDCGKRRHGSGPFWGAYFENGVWNGRNVLGTLWMDIRDALRAEEAGSLG